VEAGTRPAAKEAEVDMCYSADKEEHHSEEGTAADWRQTTMAKADTRYSEEEGMAADWPR
jgi:hypothetical protein